MTDQQEPHLQVDSAFPGGNIIVDSIEGTSVTVHQDLRDTEGDWFYWYFRLRGGAGSTVSIHFSDSHVIGVRGPGLSLDGGKSWHWLGTEQVTDNSFSYAIPSDAGEVRFSWGMPYVESNLTSLLHQYPDHPNLEVGALCTTEKGRTAELLRLGCISSEPQSRVILTARHHCCEMMASYVLDGIMRGVLSDSEHGEWLRQNVEFLIVPFVDKDGVEQGDQGKNRRPHDHNRDYEAGIHSTVRAIKDMTIARGKGRLHFALDLHCPWKYGPNNEDIYFVGNPEAAIWDEVERYAAILERNNSGGLSYFAANNLPFGQAWNTQSNYISGESGKPLCSCTRWMAQQPGIRAAATLEIPYANASGAVVDQQSATLFGEDIAKAMRIYLDRSA